MYTDKYTKFVISAKTNNYHNRDINTTSLEKVSQIGWIASE